MIITSRNPSFTNKQPTTFQAGDTAGLAMWVKQRQSESTGNQLVEGRILDTGVNFIVEGARLSDDTWVRIPCRRLLDAQLHLAKVMDKDLFDCYASMFKGIV